jgi:hypothetical protein
MLSKTTQMIAGQCFDDYANVVALGNASSDVVYVTSSDHLSRLKSGESSVAMIGFPLSMAYHLPKDDVSLKPE